MDTLKRQLVDQALAKQADELADDDFEVPNDAFFKLYDTVSAPDLDDIANDYWERGVNERILLYRLAAETTTSAPLERRLVRQLGEARDLDELRWLIRVFVYRQCDDAVPPLLDLMGRAAPYTLFTLADALSSHVTGSNGNAALDGLLALAGHEDPDVRWSSLYELKAHLEDGLRDPRAAQAVETARSDQDPTVQELFRWDPHPSK